MLAVQTRNPGRGYPPPGPWPHWNDLAGESSDMVFEIHSKLANKRQEIAPFYAARLRDAGLQGAGRLPEPGSPAPETPEYAPPTPEFGFEPPIGSPITPDPLPRPRPSGGVVPGKRHIVQGHIVYGRPVRDWPEPELGFDETGGMSSGAAYSTPSSSEEGGYMSANDGKLALRSASEKMRRANSMQWPGNANSKDSGARASTWVPPRQSLGTSIANIGGNLMRATEHTLQLVDGATSLAASGIGAAATIAQTGAATAHAVADATNMIGGIVGGAPRPRYRPRRATGGGDPGDDSPPGEPPLLSIEDGRASESDVEVLPRPALPITGGPIAVERPEFLRRSSHRGTRPTFPGAPSRTTGPGLGTRWVNHRGPGA
jgi:hypothetical protein